MLRVLGVLVGLALMPMPQAAAQTLADTFVAAYRNSELLEQNRALLRVSDEDLFQAQSRLLPVVNFITRATASQQRIEMRGAPTVTNSTARLNFGLSAEITLVDFGRGRLAIDFAREQVFSARAGLIVVEQQVLLQAAQAYLNVISQRDTVALRRANMALIEQELRAARQRFELGDSTRTDVAIAEARLAAAQSALAAAEGDLAVAREDYRLAVGVYPDNLRQPPRLPRLPATLAEGQALARRQHPAILQAQHQVSAADLMVESARAGRLGAVTGEVGAGVAGESGRVVRDLSGSITWAVPLYDGGRLNSSERQAVAQREAQRAALNQQVAGVLQSVGANWAQLEVARARLAASALQIEAAQTAYDAVRAEAELGSRTTLDVLNAEQELLDARSARIAATAGVQLASYALLQATGQLTVASLNLGIPTYDVEAYAAGFARSRPVSAPRSEQGDRLDRIMGRHGTGAGGDVLNLGP
ncbi:MAG: TolC family outer membrane protein [Pararhodobacter sp.]|nr:TolC family outer membrane protein [Pararhodobacter sp.]